MKNIDVLLEFSEWRCSHCVHVVIQLEIDIADSIEEFVE